MLSVISQHTSHHETSVTASGGVRGIYQKHRPTICLQRFLRSWHASRSFKVSNHRSFIYLLRLKLRHDSPNELDNFVETDPRTSSVFILFANITFGQENRVFFGGKASFFTQIPTLLCLRFYAQPGAQDRDSQKSAA